MECTKAQYAPESPLATPISTGCDCQLTGDVVFVVIDIKTERPVDMLYTQPPISNVVRFGGTVRTSSTSSPSPDSPRTMPSGVPII